MSNSFRKNTVPIDTVWATVPLSPVRINVQCPGPLSFDPYRGYEKVSAMHFTTFITCTSYY